MDFKLRQLLWRAWGKSNFYQEGILKPEDIHLEHPKEEAHGDWATNIALALSKKLKENPQKIAREIISKLPKSEMLEKVEEAVGFINFWLAKKPLLESATEAIKLKEGFGQGKTLVGKKIMVEFCHPNTHKAFHIGHLRNITLGESLVRILEASGVRVFRANYQGDIGMHIAKCLYGILQISNFKFQISKIKNLNDKVEFLGKAYAQGSKAYEESEKVKKEIGILNKKIYEKNPKIFPLWQETRQWSLDYFDSIYKRVYTKYDRYYFESEVWEKGREIVLDNLKKGIFEKSEGAVIFNGEKFGLHKRVFVNKEGFSTYEAKDMELGRLQFAEYKPDLIIHVVGPEQSGYFQVVFEALAQIFPYTRGREYHLAYGWVRLKKGKMSSRLGNVVLSEWLISEVKRRIREKIGKMEEGVAESVAVGAVKYSLLKFSPTSGIAFDIDESINLEGNSGPYIQYTYARAQSVLRKINSPAGGQIPEKQDLRTIPGIERRKFRELTLAKRECVSPKNLKLEELAILRTLYKFPEVVKASATSYAPNFLCEYLYDLAQKYNSFYNKHSILTPKEKEKEVRDFRILLTAATAQVLKNGLTLLGIKPLERM